MIGPGPPTIVGGELSATVIVCVHVAELPQVSVAWYVRVMTLLQFDVPFDAERRGDRLRPPRP